MEQLLLLTFTEQKTGRAVKMGNTEDTTSVLKEMRSYLEAVNTDLLQPRPEALQQLLKRSRQ